MELVSFSDDRLMGIVSVTTDWDRLLMSGKLTKLRRPFFPNRQVLLWGFCSFSAPE